jgi:hypothetical protein
MYFLPLKIKLDGETNDPIEALNMFMAILMKSVENARQDYEILRVERYQTVMVNEFLHENSELIRNLYDDLKRSTDYIN